MDAGRFSRDGYGTTRQSVPRPMASQACYDDMVWFSCDPTIDILV